VLYYYHTQNIELRHRKSSKDSRRFTYPPCLSFSTAMDTTTAYFTIFSSFLAVKVLILALLCIFTAIFPPTDEEVEFPPPRGYSGTETKKVEVPKYPSFSDLLFLLLAYILDIIFIYPLTQSGRETPFFHPVFIACKSVALGLQAVAAVGWSGIGVSWLAAEKKYGLWHSNAWGLYYHSFILVGVGMGIPLFFNLSWYIVEFSIASAPTIARALYEAYEPLFRLGRICVRYMLDG